MNWLLGGGMVGALGVLAMAFIFLRKMHYENRGDLKEKLETDKLLSEAKSSIEDHQRTIDDLQTIIGLKNDEIERERGARAVAQQSLATTRKKLAKIGDASDVVNDINDTLSELAFVGRVLPEVPSTPDT